ncbi:MAG: M17 family peptidase N-terminal domain-containing protein [Deltaproteobacteria bacterium]|nr:M17 family peptidase N-terminal domain-containing protein [Deltaproteobacteria bacterium]
MIHLVLTAKPIDEAGGRLAVVTFFEDLRPLKGQAGLLDWRLNGKLSELILKGKMEGKFLEALMMPSRGRIGSQEILLFGLGPVKELTEKNLSDIFGNIIQKIEKLKVCEFVICFSDLAHDFMSWRSLLRSFVTTLALQYGEKEFKVICAEDLRYVNETRRRNMDFGTQVTLHYDDDEAEISKVSETSAHVA